VTRRHASGTLLGVGLTIGDGESPKPNFRQLNPGCTCASNRNKSRRTKVLHVLYSCAAALLHGGKSPETVSLGLDMAVAAVTPPCKSVCMRLPSIPSTFALFNGSFYMYDEECSVTFNSPRDHFICTLHCVRFRSARVANAYIQEAAADRGKWIGSSSIPLCLWNAAARESCRGCNGPHTSGQRYIASIYALSQVTVYISGNALVSINAVWRK